MPFDSLSSASVKFVWIQGCMLIKLSFFWWSATSATLPATTPTQPDQIESGDDVREVFSSSGNICKKSDQKFLVPGISFCSSDCKQAEEYVVNFAPELQEITTETKYIEQLGFVVPELARNVALQVCLQFVWYVLFPKVKNKWKRAQCK